MRPGQQFAAITLLLCGLAGAAGAAPPVVVVRPVEPVAVAPRHPARARVIVAVDQGFHVQANPPSADYLIATKLTLKPAPGLKVGVVAYPKGQTFKLEGSNEELSTYMGTFEIVVPVSATGRARPGERKLQGTLRYQACDEKACYAPVTVALEVPVRVQRR